MPSRSPAETEPVLDLVGELIEQFLPDQAYVIIIRPFTSDPDGGGTIHYGANIDEESMIDAFERAAVNMKVERERNRNPSDEGTADAPAK